MKKVCLLLGSNLGDRLLYLSQAIERLHDADTSVQLVSHVYESNPWGFDSFDRFLNLALVMHVGLTPLQLLQKCQTVESELGRVRNREGYSSRTIDIDILLYGEEVIDTELLTIPHPRLPLRRFALVPAVQLMATALHPVLKISMSQLLLSCPDQGDVVYFCHSDKVWANPSK